MKRKLLLLVGISLSMTGLAQTSPGLHVAASVSAVSIETPLNSYLKPVEQQNINLTAEALYMGSVFGLGVTAQTDFDMDSKLIAGMKGYVNVLRLNTVQLGAAFAAQSRIDHLENHWQFKPEVNASIPLVDKLDARGSFTGTVFSGHSKMYPGFAVGLSYRL